MECVNYNGEIAYRTKYDGYYATKSGKIISVKVKGGCGRIDYSKPREHNYKVDKDGYLECCFSMLDENGKHIRKYERVHRIVWETFNGEIKDDLTIDHIDRNTQNNNLSNLRLLTREENASIAKEGIKSPKRFIYKLYKNNEYIGSYDRNELKDIIGLRYFEFYKNTSHVKELKNEGYLWVKENVEDIERVS